ncbi:universal stress protein [Sulfitobacter sp. D35]|uniref:universal stress protein n=1 Tax=Sulfitobacter sp. D35 TaxID=3083252 RepID=UPI00296F0497|nr:universal stress protein [Sulfitobacter sp. D35]MDW4498560.1 universal stress protein [Sulfitobacter sp. D35]
MYNNILVPVVLDHSRNVEAAIDVARQLSDEGATVTLLHVVETIPDYVSEYLPPDVIRKRHEEMEADLAALTKTLDGAKAAVVQGRAGHEITSHADTHGCDCIVIASHAPELADILLGSTANYVVRHAKCAVHVLR